MTRPIKRKPVPFEFGSRKTAEKDARYWRRSGYGASVVKRVGYWKVFVTTRRLRK